MKCIAPQPLKQGDEVAIVAVSKKVDSASIESAVKILEQWGLVVKLAKNLDLATNTIFAGTDQERLESIQSMINDDQIKAIFCARGGYGATRIIDQIDFNPLLAYPKWIIGFSDITVLLCQTIHSNVESVHGLLAFQFHNEQYRDSLESLKNLLFNKVYTITVKPHDLNRYGSATASVVGGNLTMLTNLLGTSTDFDPSGKILLLEDIEEYLYKIDRMMIHLKRAGKLHNLAGAIIGHMTDMLDNEIPYGKTAYEIIYEHLEPLNIPVSFGFPSGHEPHNLAVPFGRKAFFEVSNTGTVLRFEE